MYLIKYNDWTLAGYHCGDWDIYVTSFSKFLFYEIALSPILREYAYFWFEPHLTINPDLNQVWMLHYFGLLITKDDILEFISSNLLIVINRTKPNFYITLFGH